jgi:hypothetical protein
VPLAKGGTDDPKNIQYLCQNCHHDKTHLEDKINFWLGRKHSLETRRKISLSKKGSSNTLKAVAASADVRRGKSLSAEHKSKISARGKGQKRTETTCLNIRIAKLTALREENGGRFRAAIH